VFVRSRSQSRSARNDSELKLIVANRDKHGNSKGTDRTLTVTAEGRRLFIEALLNPPKPNEKAIAAARRLKEEIAVGRSHSTNIASVAVVVDAIDENARAFYRRYGFIDIPNHPNRFFIPMKTVAQLFPSIDAE
jgi:hypothetical protein